MLQMQVYRGHGRRWFPGAALAPLACHYSFVAFSGAITVCSAWRDSWVSVGLSFCGSLSCCSLSEGHHVLSQCAQQKIAEIMFMSCVNML